MDPVIVMGTKVTQPILADSNCKMSNMSKDGPCSKGLQIKAENKVEKKNHSPTASKVGVHESQDKETSDGSDSNGEVFNIFQLSNPADNFIVSVKINGIKIVNDMEVDSGAQRITVPWNLFQGQLATASCLMPTSVIL